MNYYDILQVLPTALTEVIHMAYKALVKKYHPDVYMGDKKYAEEKMKLITEAYRVLSDPQKRKEYDENLFRKSHQSSSTQSNSTQNNNAQSGNTQNGNRTTKNYSQTKKSYSDSVLNSFYVMFKNLIEHTDYTIPYIEKVQRVVGTDNALKQVLNELKKNYRDFESDFLLPGAMLIVLEKYKNLENTKEYKDICQQYSSYMNRIFNLQIPYNSCNNIFSSPIGKVYFSLVKEANRSPFEGVLLTRDIDAYKAAYELYSNAIRSFISDEENEVNEEEARIKRTSERFLKYIECWCDPFSFYPEKISADFEIVKGKSEATEVYDRYISFAKRLLTENVDFCDVCHCLKKAAEKDNNLCQRSTSLINEIINKCSTTDNYSDIWRSLKRCLPKNVYVYTKHIEFEGKRWLDNFDEFSRTAEKRIINFSDEMSFELVNNLDKLMKSVEHEIAFYENRTKSEPEHMRSILYSEVNRQRKLVSEKYDSTSFYVNKIITDYNSEKYWIPENRCRYCGGAFKGTFKKVCIRCGKAKDYK